MTITRPLHLRISLTVIVAEQLSAEFLLRLHERLEEEGGSKPAAFWGSRGVARLCRRIGRR
jgi:hypothetical protein